MVKVLGNVRLQSLLCVVFQVCVTCWMGFLAVDLPQNNSISHFTASFDVSLPHDYFALALQQDKAKPQAAAQLIQEIKETAGVLFAVTPSDRQTPIGIALSVHFPPARSGDFDIAYFTTTAESGAQVVAQIQEQLETYRRQHGQVHLAGDAVVNYHLDQESRQTRTIFSVLLIACLLASALFSRSLRVALITAGSILTPLAVTMGTYGLLGYQLDLLTNLIPVLILVLSLAMQMHVHLSVMRHGCVLKGLRSKLRANLLVTTTTSIGFISLVTSELAPIRTLGIFMAVSMWLIFVWVHVSYLGIGRIGQAIYPPVPKGFRILPLLSARKTGVAPIGFTLFASVTIFCGALAIYHTPVQSNGLYYFKANHPVRVDTDFFEHHVTGSCALTIDLPQNVDSGSVNQFMDRMRALDQIRHAFINPNPTSRQMVLMVNSIDSQSYKQLVEQLDLEFYKHFSPTQALKVGGPLAAVSLVQEQLLQSLGRSILTSFVFISLLIMLLVPRRVGFAIAWLPNLFPLACMALFMWVAGIQLSVATILVFSVAYGVAVDDTIHLTQKYLTAPDPAFWQQVVRTEGLAVLMTTTILVVGFAAIGLSSFQPLSHFGMLLSVGMLTAWLGDLWILPAVLGWLKPKHQQGVLHGPADR